MALNSYFMNLYSLLFVVNVSEKSHTVARWCVGSTAANDERLISRLRFRIFINCLSAREKIKLRDWMEFPWKSATLNLGRSDTILRFMSVTDFSTYRLGVPQFLLSARCVTIGDGFVECRSGAVYHSVAHPSAGDRQRFKLFTLPSLLRDSAGNNVANSWQHNQVWVSSADYAVDPRRLNSIRQTTAQVLVGIRIKA